MAVFIVDGKGGHERLVPISTTFFNTVAGYLSTERPTDATTDRLFVALKGPTRGGALSASGFDEVLTGARRRAGLTRGTCHELRHTCFTRLRQAGMAIEAIQALAGHRSITSTRVYLHLGEAGLPRSTGARSAPSTPPRTPGRPDDRPPASRQC